MKAHMIIDLQYGSTGKGLLAGYLAETRNPDVVVTAWGPNAGHTYIDGNGRKFIHRMLANGIVSRRLRTVLIGPGSVIDPHCLYQECLNSRDLLEGKKIVVHPHAAVVLPEHAKEEEKTMVGIGSTMKGTGQALISRIQRKQDSAVAAFKFPRYVALGLKQVGIELVVSDTQYEAEMNDAACLQIEGAQGFSLSMYHGFYPYTTSRDVTPHQVLADCAVPYHVYPEIIGTIRTYPIRVSNRYDEKGVMVGSSGPCYYDQEELSWEDLGVEPERTTVTNLERRIFSFSMCQLAEAVRMCGPDSLFLNFCNYMEPDELKALIEAIDKEGSAVRYLGKGPSKNDVIERHKRGEWK